MKFPTIIFKCILFFSIAGCVQDSNSSSKNNETVLGKEIEAGQMESNRQVKSFENIELCLKSSDSTKSIGQFNLTHLPYSSKDLFFNNVKGGLKYPLNESFDERNFMYYQISPLQRDTIWIGNILGKYPCGLFPANRYKIILLMNLIGEPGQLEPDVTAYIIDRRNQVRDSMLIHRTYNWENTIETRFKLGEDTVLLVTSFTKWYPYSDDPSDSDSLNLWETKRIAKKYFIGSNLKFQEIN